MFSKFLKLIVTMVFLTIQMYAQSDASKESLPSNSFERIYKKKYPDLNYTYDSLSQTHDYSNNWDFDGDGKKDKLLFIGNGAVHLYFHLQIWLSSNKKTYTFPFLAIDLPIFANGVKLDNDGKPEISQQFVVANFDNDKLPEIYISLDEKDKIPQKWKNKGLSSYQIIVDYSKGRLELKNYR